MLLVAVCKVTICYIWKGKPYDETIIIMKDNKRYLTGSMWAAILVLIFYLFMSGGFDILIYNRLGVFVIALLVLVGIPLLFIKVFTSFFSKNTGLVAGMVTAVASIVFIALYFTFFSDKHEAEAYRKYGVKTKGVVTDAFYNKGFCMRYKFWVNNKEYESFNVSNPLHHKIGDTIDIIYNSKRPGMNEAVEEL